MNDKKPNHSIKEDKLKPLKPTLRTKKRFVKVKINSQTKLEFKEFSEQFVEEMILLLGAIRFGKAGVWVLRDKFDFEKQEAILKVALPYKDECLGALSLITSFGKTKVKLETLRTSGTLKGVQKN